MATIPQATKLTASSVDILNAIRNQATQAYRDYVPIAVQVPSNSKEIGRILMQYPALQNEFVSALVNRIAFVRVRNMSFENPWKAFKKGLLDFGETIEDIFVELAKPFEYDPHMAESKIFKREIPDVRAAFHVINYRKFYKTTIEENELELAFLSWDGVDNLIATIVDSMYKGAEYDEFLTMKYMVAKHIINGHLYPVTPSGDTTTSKAIDYKSISNALTFPSTKYNMAGVKNTTPRENQYLIMTTDADARMDVNVLASAFHMDKAEFMGHRILVDSFSEFDTERLQLIFADADETFEPFTSDELELLASVEAVLVDERWFMIYDKLFKFTEQYNGEGIYWNYWLHVWKTFSASPFMNAVVFASGVTSAVSAVSVSPATLSVAPVEGLVIGFKASVTKTGFANEQVEWSLSDNAEDYARIDESGNVLITGIPDADTAITVTAKSIYDDTVTGTATLTLDV